MEEGDDLEERAIVAAPDARMRYRLRARFARLSRRRRISGLIALVVIVATAILWWQRRDIAQGYADDLLRQRNVPATYRIAELGPGGQRLENVVMGDPARPDLTADWIETTTRLTLSGPKVTAVRAGRVRMRGRVVDGRLSLGVVDRLLPPPSGAPFAFPDIDLAVADGRMRLATPAGAVGLKLSGRGGLKGGFSGQLAAVAPRLALAGCTADQTSAFWRVRIGAGGAPRVTGPLRAALLACGSYRAAGIAAGIDLSLGAALDRWTGQARPAVAELRGPQLWLKRIGGALDFAGDRRGTGGGVSLTSGASAAYGASAASARVVGRYRVGGAAPSFAGSVTADHASLPARWRAAAAGLRDAGAGTPVAPILDRLGGALSLAGRDASITADLAILGSAGTVSRFETRSASGAIIGFAGDGIAVGPTGVRINGTLTARGGGLPRGRLDIVQSAPGVPLIGTARFAPYQAGTATLALTPIRFSATRGGNTLFRTQATLSGPLADGRVDRATVPLVGAWNGGGRFVLNPTCAPAGFDGLRAAGLVLDRARFTLCPVGRAVLTLDRGRIGGGVRVAAPRLQGTLGGSALSLAADNGVLRFDTGALRLDRLAVRLGTAPRQSRLDLATLTGRIDGGAIAGAYTGGAGQVGAVPLLLSDAVGTWRLANGALALDGGLTVADANTASPRMKPLPVRDVRLTLANGRIDAGGQVRAPNGITPVANVTLSHDLDAGTGSADILVPGIAFDEALRPDMLTPLTFGVVANVRGVIRGEGRIRWTPRGVTSSGTFGTQSMDLAAAFGPVTGLKTQIAFTDLLALESAPGQVATVGSVNPGVPVQDGVFRYRLLSGARVQVEGARWPLAGGELILEPTLLDFSRPTQRRMTFRIVGLDARQFLQTFEYDNLDATGIFDGVLPIVFDSEGGNLENGRLSSRAGGTLAYRGEISKENLGTWGNLAFGALRSLRFRSLELTLDGPLAGNIVTRARFAGIAQGEGATSNFLIRRLAKLPFVFNVRIEAPFRGLIGSIRSLYDPRVLIEQNLPTLIREQERVERETAKSIQPPASENKP